MKLKIQYPLETSKEVFDRYNIENEQIKVSNDKKKTKRTILTLIVELILLILMLMIVTVYWQNIILGLLLVVTPVYFPRILAIFPQYSTDKFWIINSEMQEEYMDNLLNYTKNIVPKLQYLAKCESLQGKDILEIETGTDEIDITCESRDGDKEIINFMIPIKQNSKITIPILNLAEREYVIPFTKENDDTKE